MKELGADPARPQGGRPTGGDGMDLRGVRPGPQAGSTAWQPVAVEKPPPLSLGVFACEMGTVLLCPKDCS